ncbi:MAG: hypothetical protein R3Y64_09985, partial [Peptostreptococcaceae bacterium]
KLKRRDYDMSYFSNPKLDIGQIEQIAKGIDQSLDVTVFMDDKFSADEMSEIRFSLKEEGVNTSSYFKNKKDESCSSFKGNLIDELNEVIFPKSKYSSFEENLIDELNKIIFAKYKKSSFYKNNILALRELRIAFSKGYDLDIYLSEENFNSKTMKAITIGLDYGVEHKRFLKEEYNSYKMLEVIYGLKDGLDISFYENPIYSSDQMAEIRYGLKEGLDVSKYANPKLNDCEMRQVRYGLRDGVDLVGYLDDGYDDGQVAQIRIGLKDNINVNIYLDKEIDFEVMSEIRKSLKDKTFKRSDWFDFDISISKFLIKNEYKKVY